MTTNEKMIGTIAAALAALAAGLATAQVHPEKPTYAYEKCYGVARQGMNDCFFAANSCAGTSDHDGSRGPGCISLKAPASGSSAEACCRLRRSDPKAGRIRRVETAMQRAGSI